MVTHSRSILQSLTLVGAGAVALGLPAVARVAHAELPERPAPPASANVLSASGGIPASVFPVGANVSSGQYIPSNPNGHTVLVVGDSLSIPLSDRMELHLRAQASPVGLVHVGKVSSGLARPDFFDWNDQLKRLVSAAQPDVVVVVLAANDNKPLSSGGRVVPFESPEWELEYGRRVQQLLAIAKSANPRTYVLWVGAPVMAEPKLRRDLRTVNHAIERACRRQDSCRFVTTEQALLGANGKFSFYLGNDEGKVERARAADGVHLTAWGAELLLRALPSSVWSMHTIPVRPEHRR